MIAIILLNWNGWRDTLDCIDSLFDMVEKNFFVVLVDNNSQDNSINNIKKHIEEKNYDSLFLKEDEKLTRSINKREIVLYALKANYGFAKGNNKAIELLSGQDISYYWILNNDTIVTKNALSILKKFLVDNKRYIGCTPQIRYFAEQKKIWNCGGRLFFGFRKYYYANEAIEKVRKNNFDIQFVTGCALFVRKDVLKKCRIFTEKFFFGEEDFEFSMRMKRENKILACCVDSIIYHKVSSSTKNSPRLSKKYIYYLNRYINIRQQYGKSKFEIWRFVSNLYTTTLLFRQRYSLSQVFKFMMQLNSDCYKYEGVDYKLFKELLDTR